MDRRVGLRQRFLQEVVGGVDVLGPAPRQAQQGTQQWPDGPLKRLAIAGLQQLDEGLVRRGVHVVCERVAVGVHLLV